MRSNRSFFRSFERVAVEFAALSGAMLLPAAALAVDHIPFTDVNGGLIEVQASVDGRPSVPMLVDLGAGVDVFSSSFGRQFVTVDGKYVSLRLSGERVDLPIGTIVSLGIGGVGVEAPHVGIWKGLDGSGVEGLISATAFRNIATTFNFHDHELIIEDAQTFPERKRMGVRVPLILQDDLGISLGLFARFDFGGGKTGLCELDTGSQGIMIDRSFASRLGVNLNDPQLKHVHLAAGDGVVASIPSISLIGAPDTALTRPTVTFADLIYDCNVGNQFWAGRTFTLDLPNRAMWIAPAS
jgi:hypothetical protein